MATKIETPKSIPAIAAEIVGTRLTLAFATGGRITVDADALTDALRTQAMMHGLKQKLVDAAAISRNPETGRSASGEDKYNAVREVAERLLTGEWNKAREGGGNTGGQLFRALCQLYSRKTPEAIKAWLDSKTDAEKAALRACPEVAAIIATFKTPSSDVDTDALLRGLED
jgi:hypothetical protein